MKFSYGLYSVLAGAALFAAQGASAQTEAVKTAPAYSLLPNAYGSIDLRHYDLREIQDDRSVSKAPRLHSRLVLGSTFMQDKLDVSLAMGVSALPQTEKFKQRRPEINAKYTFNIGDFAEVGPELQILTPHEGQGTGGTDASPGFFASANSPSYELAGGKLSASLSGEWTTHFSSRNSDATVENESPKTIKELGLVGDEQAKSGTRPDGKQDLDYNAEYIAGVKYSVGAFGVDLSQYLDQNYLPRYVASGENGDIEVSYPVKTTTTESVKFSYKATERTTFSNETLLQQGGVYESRLYGSDDNKGLPAFSNIAKVTYKL